MFPKDVKEALENTYMPLFHPFLPYRVLYLATCSKDGEPNLTIISFAKVFKNKILIPDVALLKSIHNIQENPEVSILVMIYRDYEIVNGWKKLLHKLTKNLVSIDFSFFGIIKIRILLFLYSIFKSLIPKAEYKISFKGAKIFEIKGKAKILKEGEVFEKMNKFFKIVFGKKFELKGLVEIEWERIEKTELKK